MILVTGASGFVGRQVMATAVRRGLSVRGASRDLPVPALANAEHVISPDLAPGSDWRNVLDGVEVVVHAAARVHVMNDVANDPIFAFRRVNVAGTTELARQAARAGARRFVFISSIKVNGERTADGRPFLATDEPAPIDPYGISKHEAEATLHRVATEVGLELVIIRPVLVYGPGVKANFAAMMHWLLRGVPLPFGALHNRRSLVAIDNLVDLILLCVSHPAAPGQTFLVSDGEDISTTALLTRMADALGVRPRLLPVPRSVLWACTRLLRREDLGRRLFESLQVDIRPTMERLGWAPPVLVRDALRETAQEFLLRRAGR